MLLRERTLLSKISPRSYICAQSPSRILALGLITVILRLVTGFLPVFATFHAFFFFGSSFSDALPSPFFLFFWFHQSMNEYDAGEPSPPTPIPEGC